jgi:SAM-dependent methyltransferase
MEAKKHYDELTTRRKTLDRRDSSMYTLRQRQNAYKDHVIRQTVVSGDHVLDFCCGCGGDVQKYDGLAQSYAGVDIAANSLEEARKRAHQTNMLCEFVCADANEVRDLSFASGRTTFDVVSCMFAAHYLRDPVTWLCKWQARHIILIVPDTDAMIQLMGSENDGIILDDENRPCATLVPVVNQNWYDITLTEYYADCSNNYINGREQYFDVGAFINGAANHAYAVTTNQNLGESTAADGTPTHIRQIMSLYRCLVLAKRPKVDVVNLIVPFRDDLEHKRRDQLQQLISWMKAMFGSTHNAVPYHIYVVHQLDYSVEFNRGLCLNIGAKYMVDRGADQFICHDCDLLPDYISTPCIRDAYMDRCDGARHLAGGWTRYTGDQFWGGITMFNTRFFQLIDGFPNFFKHGWGGEDDAVVHSMKHAVKSMLARHEQPPALEKVRDGAIIDLEMMTLFEKLASVDYHAQRKERKLKAIKKHKKRIKRNQTDGLRNVDAYVRLFSCNDDSPAVTYINFGVSYA